jgi:predicted ATP-binding protein involved in virulence
MKVKELCVIGLFGRGEEELTLRFNEDLNILTGRNGSGKTSLLKLLWYILSGNLLLALREVNFKRATLVTSEYTCTIIRTGKQSCKVEFESNGSSHVFEDLDDEDGFSAFAEDMANEALQQFGSSVFLPTFRRIEGGFTTGSVSASASSASANAARAVRSSRNEIEESLSSA